MENYNIFEGSIRFEYQDKDGVLYGIYANSEEEADRKWQHFNGNDWFITFEIWRFAVAKKLIFLGPCGVPKIVGRSE